VHGALSQERDAEGHPVCEAGCYRCLLSYYNQPDHELIDRQDKDAGGLLLDVLCRLTQASISQGTQGRGPVEHDAQLVRTAGSSLEQAWLDHVNAHGYRKPDRGQHTIAAAGCCADFFYDELNLAVFVDGPHHDTEAQQAKDAAIDCRLDELGFLVVRFPKDRSSWPSIFERNADLFGPGKS
jgi:very-short-patch-repair endonuclease